MKKKHLQPAHPAALYARVSSDRQDVDLSVSAHHAIFEPPIEKFAEELVSEVAPKALTSFVQDDMGVKSVSDKS